MNNIFLKNLQTEIWKKIFKLSYKQYFFETPHQYQYNFFEFTRVCVVFQKM